MLHSTPPSFLQTWALSFTQKTPRLVGVFLSGLNPQFVNGRPLGEPRFVYDRLASQWHDGQQTQEGLLLIPTNLSPRETASFSIPGFVQAATQTLGMPLPPERTSEPHLVVMAHSAGGSLLTNSLESLYPSLRAALWLDGINGPQENEALFVSLQRILHQQAQQLEGCSQDPACFGATLARQPFFVWYHTSGYTEHHNLFRKQWNRLTRDLIAAHPQVPREVLHALQRRYVLIAKEGVSHSDLMRVGAVREALQILFSTFPQS